MFSRFKYCISNFFANEKGVIVMVETKSQKEPSDVYDRFTQELDEKQRRAFEKLTQKQKLAIIKDYLRKY